MQQSTRIPAIDIAKGLGIFCIILGHVIPDLHIRSLLYSFHVPLFFLLSGLTFRPRQDKRRFYAGKARRILVPYLAFSLISIVIYRLGAVYIGVSSKEARIIPNLFGMLYANTNNGLMNWNRPLWFLPCLFAVLVIIDLFESCLLRLKIRHAQLFRLLFALGCTFLGALLNKCIPALYLPFHLESAVLLAGFAALGVILQHARALERIGRCSVGIRALMAAAILLFFLLIVRPSAAGAVDIRAHMLGNNPLMLLIRATSISLCVLIISTLLHRLSFLQQWGRSSMSMLLMHKFPLLIFQYLIPITGALLKRPTLAGTLCSIGVTLATVYLCIIVEKLFRRFCPIMLGQTRST